MPKGICLIGWTNKEGFFLIGKYPEECQLTDEEIMRIGSLHRMRRLDANIITLKLKELNCASFFSGLITAQYHIAPNFIIAFLLDKNEDPKDYLKTLPLGAKIVLSEFPVKRFDARTTTYHDVLSIIGQTYKQTLPALFEALSNNKIEVNEDELAIILAAEQKAATIEREYEQLKENLKNKENMIETLHNMIKEHTEQIRSEETLARFKATLDSKMQIEELKAKVSALQKEISDKEEAFKEGQKMNSIHQETITLLLDYKLVMQQRDIETREFLKGLLDTMRSYDDDFHIDLIDRIEDYLRHIEWIPEMD